MKIHNVRMGLATNSSSTHSLIFMSPAIYQKTRTDEYGDFGWSYFTAADKTSKENYLGYILQARLHNLLGESNGDVVLNSLFPHRENFANELEHGGYGVDHQSHFGLPVNWNGKGIDLEFAAALRDYIINNPIAILGGNDNSEGPSGHPLWGNGKHVDLGIDEYWGEGVVARNDGDHWVVFNRSNGTKIRLSLTSETCKVDTVTKAKTPELVDIKITDFCPFGCPYCYQASTTKGAHADKHIVSTLARSLADLKVFEVALGGGEPTMHPDFIEILEDFRYHNIVPNFTTKNLAWLLDDDRRDKILSAIGSFAYSVSTREDVARIAALAEKYSVEPHRWRSSDKFSVQYVLNTGGDLYGVLDEARKHYIRVVLLGFKTTGFGKDFATSPEDWIAIVKQIRKDNGWLTLGVDTAIVQQYGTTIHKDLGIPHELMTANEGKFSMYIDAVTKRMAPSSYCDESLYVPFEREEKGKYDEWNHWDNSELIEAAFQKW